jgi:hypothetical protein
MDESAKLLTIAGADLLNHYFIEGECLGHHHLFKIEIKTVYLPTEHSWRAITGPVDIPRCPHCHTLAVKLNKGNPLPMVH